MNATDAFKRLAGCRAAQPGLGQILVSSEIVDVLLNERRDPCSCCGQGESDALPFHDYQQENQ